MALLTLVYLGCVVGDGTLPEDEPITRVDLTDAGRDRGGRTDAGLPVDRDSGPPAAGGDAGPRDGGGGDAGPVDAGTADAGAGDGGGADADAGPPPIDAGPIVYPTSAGWTFHGPEQGGPAEVRSASIDQGGNLWVAGGEEGLFVLRSGAQRFERYTAAHGLSSYTDALGVQGLPAISVAGGPSGVAFVGYAGLHGGAGENDPPYMLKSGDADRVELIPGGISVKHIDISTPPGVSSTYPNGRDMIRDVFRVVYDARTQDVWFGGNHGVALLEGSRGTMFEHQHADINGYTAAGHYTLLSGEYYGIGLDAAGDFWFGGGHRLGKLAYAQGRQFYSTLTRTDVWPDQIPTDAYPHQRTDDFVQDLAIRGGCVWVGSIPNGLAEVCPTATSYLKTGMVDPKVTALEADPKDGSLWVGHIWGGVTRLKDGQLLHYDRNVLGDSLTRGLVPDIQSVVQNGKRLIIVSFGRGAVGVYSGD